MPQLNPEAYTMRPFNAANTLAQATDISGAQTQNALAQLQLQRERDPMSAVNRARELEVQGAEIGQNAAREQLQAAQLQNAQPQLSSLLGALGDVRATMGSKGVSAARQRLNERIGFLQSSGILPEDFELDADLDSMSDEDFMTEIEQAEQDVSSTLASIQTGDRQARVSADIGDMEAIGMELTEENYRRFQEMKGEQGGERIESLLQEARLMGLLQEQRERETEAEREEEQRSQAREAQRQQVERNLEQNAMAVDLTESLQGTMLESGSFIPADFRRGLASLRQLASPLTGEDSGEISQMIADFDTQRKALQDQVNTRLSSGDYGRSATQLNSIERSLANPDISPQAIIRIQGQLAQIDLDRADNEDLEIPNREEWERRADEWKNYSATSPQNIRRMNRRQIESLDIDLLTDEQANAAIERLDELDQQ